MGKEDRGRRSLSFTVIRGKVLGVNVYRGYAPLSSLASISKADIYDQRSNPCGTQRDLNASHARGAYEYVKNRDLAFWPEVFLCVREKTAIEFSPHDKAGDVGKLMVFLEVVENPQTIAISRVDGNHRLHYADGKEQGFTPIDREVSFCLAFDLNREEEITLFRDINDNQRRMNTSHLDNIHARLTPEETLKRTDPGLYIARSLGQDKDSALTGLVYEGGRRPVGCFIPLRTLKTGLQYMLSRPTKLTALGDPDAQYKVIRSFFVAVKRWQPPAWSEPRRHIVLRGSGLWAICFIGAEVIDRVLANGKFGVSDMLAVLKSGRDWDWSNKGDFQGLGGRGGAVKISSQVAAEFRDDKGVSIKELYRQIVES